MRVCLVSTAHDARDDRLYFKMARSLARKHDVTLIAPILHDGHAPQDENLTFVPLGFSATKTARLRMAFRLLWMLGKGRFDVVHVSDIEMMPFVPLLKWRTGAKVVYDIWEANYELILGPEAKPGAVRRSLANAVRAAERFVAKRCDLVLTADSAIAESLRPGTAATVIFNFPLLSALAASDRSFEDLRAKWHGKRCLIYQGSMSEDRGVLAAVEAMAHVVPTNPGAKLLLVGRMPRELAEAVFSVVRSQGLGEIVHCIDWVDHSEIGQWLAIAEIGLIPFRNTRKFQKNIPQKMFEYWAASLPVIATDLDPIRFYVEACGGGLLTESNEPRVLAGAILALLADPKLGGEMGRRGRAMVEQAWRWERMEEKLLDAYRSVEGRRACA